MSVMTLSDISNALGGECRGGDASFQFVSTDSRTINPGELFIALKGPQFDGHDYIAGAVERGAAAVMVSPTNNCCIADNSSGRHTPSVGPVGCIATSSIRFARGGCHRE